MKTTEAAVVAQIVAAAQLAEPIVPTAQPAPQPKKGARKMQTNKAEAHVMAMKDALVQAPQGTGAGVMHYALGDKAAKQIKTLQAGAKTGHGAQWRTVATPALNTRATALNAIAAAMGGSATITEGALLQALTAIKAQLGSGTPRSYLRAFVASGYLVPSA